MLSLLVVSCAPAEAPSCEGERTTEGACVARVPACDDHSVHDGATCRAIGAVECATGFVSDGAGGCRATLPDVACGSGTMALPGDPACAPVSTCGDGPWPSSDAAATVHVDAASAAPVPDGSRDAPYRTLDDAVRAAPIGATILLAAGKYASNVRVSRSARIIGVCPSKVTLEGTSTAITLDADVELRGVAVVSAGTGVYVTGASRARLSDLWVHDCGEAGVRIDDTRLSPDVTIERVLVERVREAGVFSASATVTVDRSVFRDVRLIDGTLGVGLVATVRPGNAAAPRLTVTRSVIERVRTAGVAADGGPVSIGATLIRDVAPSSDGSLGIGVRLASAIGDTRKPDVALDGVVIERASTAAISNDGGRLVVRGSVLRDTRPATKKPRGGVGVWALTGAEVIIERSLVEGSHGAGVVLTAATLQMTDSIVRGTTSTVEWATLGGGVVALEDRDRALYPAIVLERSLFVGNRTSGVYLQGGTLTARGCVVRGTLAQERDGSFGDGIQLVAAPRVDGAVPAVGTLEDVVIEGNVRAGVIALGAQLTMTRARLRCNGFDLEVGRNYAPLAEGGWAEAEFSLFDRGGNVCGCGGALSTCHAQSTNLEPIGATSPL